MMPNVVLASYRQQSEEELDAEQDAIEAEDELLGATSPSHPKATALG